MILKICFDVLWVLQMLLQISVLSHPAASVELPYSVGIWPAAASSPANPNFQTEFDILLTVYHYVSQQHNQLNTLSLLQSLYCVLILYMFRAGMVHRDEGRQ
jgi:hypothetical protein